MPAASPQSLKRRALAALLACCLAGPQGVRAQGSRIPLLVLPIAAGPGVQDALASRVGSLLADELRGREETQIVPGAPETGPSEAVLAGRALQQAKAALAKAVEHARKGRHPHAADELQKAIALLTAHPLALDDHGGKLLEGALVQLAVERFAAGDPDAGDLALAQLVRLAPDKQLPAEDYPPAFLHALESVRRRVLEAPRGGLRVLGEGRVLIDGRDARFAPVRFAELVPGEHAVRVERGMDVYGARIVLVAGVETKVAPVFGVTGATAEVESALLRGELDAAALDSAAGMARAAGAHAAVFGLLTRTPDGLSLRTFLALAKGGRVVPLSRAKLDDEALGAALHLLKLGDEAVAKLVANSGDVAPPIVLEQDAPEVTPLRAAAEPALAPLVEPTTPRSASPSAATSRPAEPPLVEATRLPDAEPATRSHQPDAEPAGRLPDAEPPTRFRQPDPAPAGQRIVERQPDPEPAGSRLVVPREAPRDEPVAVPAVARDRRAPQAAVESLAVREAPPAKKNHTVLWIIAGTLLAGGAATGAYFLYQGAQTPSTSTVSATWSR